ncbi:MAG: phosphate acetyltransferase [Mycoplasmataceae bacterium]|nr:phosphate acetyltransferase [Mycoplasmataceae bacterium]
MSLIDSLKEKLSRSNIKPRIVYAEGWNPNIQNAAIEVASNNTVVPILIFHKASEIPTGLTLKHIVIDRDDLSKYANLLFELRKAKGMTLEQSKELVKQPNYLATLMVKSNDADGEICGIDYTTKDTLKPALQIIKTAPGAKLVTSAFVMEKGEEQYVMGDCAINIYPTSEELANITKMISLFAKETVGFGEVRTAMLSYSTVGSGAGESVDKVRAAYDLVKNDEQLKDNNIKVFGEMQFDAAFVPSVMIKKAKGISWKQTANTFVFPNIDAGNIGYKIAQRMGQFQAVGPVLIGLALPVNDLSRGASQDDVVGLSYITGNQALSNKR